MIAFDRLCGIAVSLPEANIDTDKIIAAEHLKTISRNGLGVGLFATMRADPAFVLNQPPWCDAVILVTLDNFGCGSSREHAPWALLDFGIRAIIAPSFADIFYNNCFKNGILPIILNRAAVDDLLRRVANPGTASLTIDLPRQTIATAETTIGFDLDPARKAALLAGLDEVGRTIGYEQAIADYEIMRRHGQPWFPWLADPVPQSRLPNTK